MRNIFDTPAMAAGYARWRPAVHPLILERARPQLPLLLPVDQALDVGCGAGESTRALQSLARECLGIDPSALMIQCASTQVPSARFRVGSAEALPVPAQSMRLITAAGSLNYVDLERFFPEALRVLAPQGILLVYDFSPGRSFRGSPRLERWFLEFLERYPMPLEPNAEIHPTSLSAAHSGLSLVSCDEFAVGLSLSPSAYLEYVLTETNVAHAVGHGVPEPAIRAWCAQTLAPVFDSIPHEVVFQAYFACLSALRR